MRFSTVIAGALLAAAPAFVSAQTPTDTASGAVTTIMVGMNGTLTFNPPSVNVAQGGTVEFVFLSKNHSVYQSSFTDPCDPVANGFKAAFFPIAADLTTFPTITLQVSQTTPIWFYCPQTNPADHCKLGMVGAINPTADKTFAAFQATAMGQASNTTSTTGTTNGTTTGTTTGTTGTNSTTGTTDGSTTSGTTGTNPATGSGASIVAAPPASGTDSPTTAGATGNGTGTTGKSAGFKDARVSAVVVALGVVAGTVLAL